MKELYRVCTKKATYGIFVDQYGMIIGGAPIAKRFFGKPLFKLENFFRERRIKYEIARVPELAQGAD